METATRLDDVAVVRALREREEAAFTTLAREYHSSLLRVAQIYVSSRAVPRTLPFSALQRPVVVPEAAVEADRFRPPDDPSSPGHWASPPQEWNAPEERLLGGEVRGIVEHAIEELPPAQRAVISLRDVEGWPSGEVCNALGVTETNQRVLLHRARSKVRRAQALLEAFRTWRRT